MKLNIIILFLTLCTIALLPHASALCELPDAEIEQPFIQNAVIELFQTCPDCSFVNISTIKYPNSSVVVRNVAMTKIDTYYNYSFDKTSILGDYIYTTFGNSSANGICTQNVIFHVNSTGDDSGIGLLLILGFFAIGLLLFGWYEKNVYLVYISGILFSVVGVYSMIYGIDGLTNMYTRSIGIVSISLGVLFTVAAIYEQAWGGDNLDD